MPARQRKPDADPPTEEAPAPRSPTEALGWESRVEVRLIRLEDSVDGLRGDVETQLARVITMLERPSLHERCMAGLGEILGTAVTRLTDPAALRWTAVIILGLVALLTGASLSGWGVTIGGSTQVGIVQPPVRSQGEP
jgi:hypothetical protein